jgi:YD repeat-containing protein
LKKKIVQKNVGDVRDWYWRITHESSYEIGNGKQIQLSGVDCQYDAYGNEIGKLIWAGDKQPLKKRIEYQNSNPVEITDDSGNVKYLKYHDGFRHLKELWQGKRLVSQLLDYNCACGKPGRVIDENGQETLHTYDVLCRPVEMVYPDKSKKTFQYIDPVISDNGYTSLSHIITRQESAAGERTEAYEFFDALGHSLQVSQQTLGGYRITRTFYDKNTGRKRKVCGPYLAATPDFTNDCPNGVPVVSFFYDNRGRVTEEERELGDGKTALTKFAYDKNVTTTTDPDGSSKSVERDTADRITRIVDHSRAGDIVTQYEYTPRGELARITDSRNHLTEMKYDDLGRRIYLKDPNRGIWQYGHDNNNNLIWQKAPGGEITEFKYDERNRCISKTTKSPGFEKKNVVVRWRYDDERVPNGKGRLANAIREGVRDAITAYDKMGRVKSRFREFTLNDKRHAYKESYVYDDMGRLSSTVYPHDTVDYIYHAGTSMVDKVQHNGRVIAEFPEYDPAGQVERINYANGIYTRIDINRTSGRCLGVFHARAYEPDSGQIVRVQPGGTDFSDQQ